MQIYLSLLIALVGSFVYALSNNGKAQELGRLAYGAGLLAFLLQVAPHFVSTLR
jgi:Na+/phosphate symporter